MRSCRLVIVTAALLLPVLGGCRSEANSDLLHGEWSGNAGRSLELRSDKTHTGFDGCNTFGGRWKVTGDNAGRMVSGDTTLKGCDPGQSWGRPVATFQVDQEALVLKDDQGNVLDALTRVP